jgi:hypothetical protein
MQGKDIMTAPESSSKFPSQYFEIVRRFCSLAEKKSSKRYMEDMLQVLGISAELYWRSTSLPIIDLQELPGDWENEFDTEFGGDDSYKDPIGIRFGAYPLNADDNSGGRLDIMGVAISEMGDYLAEVYYNLKQALEWFDAGQADKALAFCRYGYESNWGWRLAEALSVVHVIVFEPRY